MADEVKTETVEEQVSETPTEQQQEQVTDDFDKDRAMKLIAKLRGEVKDLTPKARKADELEAAEAKRKEAEMTELQKLQQQLEKAESELKAKEFAEKQRNAAEKAGLPAVFAARLRGETPEELEADAKAILEAIPKPEQKQKQPGVTNPGGGASAETDEQRRKRLFG